MNNENTPTKGAFIRYICASLKLLTISQIKAVARIINSMLFK